MIDMKTTYDTLIWMGSWSGEFEVNRAGRSLCLKFLWPQFLRFSFCRPQGRETSSIGWDGEGW